MQSQQFLWLRLVLIICITLMELVHGEVRKKSKEELEKLREEIERETNPMVEIEYGKVIGRTYMGSNEEFYQSFTNIPYAREPKPYERFQKPSPPHRWDTPLDATLSVNSHKLAVRCKTYSKFGGELQYNKSAHFNQIVGQEDCLRLTIIKPLGLKKKRHQNAEDIIPWDPAGRVVVFFHPSTFMYDINMNPHRIAEHFCCNDILFVFVRFRLGILGFANLGGDGGEVVPNLGLWDQLAALKWVQRNMVAFGGDPWWVTIAGMAAGAASVNYHMLSTKSHGLFIRAISVGGSALCPWALAKESIVKTKKVAASLGCDMQTNQAIAECLSSAMPNALLEEAEKLYNDYWRSQKLVPINPLGPVVDYDFIEEHPDILMRTKHVQRVQWLVGFSSDYSIFPLHDMLHYEDSFVMVEKWWPIAKECLSLEDQIDPSIMDGTLDDIRKNYSGRVDWRSKESEDAYVSRQPEYIRNSWANVRDCVENDFCLHYSIVFEMVNDRQYTTGIVEAARLYGLAASDDKTQTFLYQMNFNNRISMADILTTPPSEWAKRHRNEFHLNMTDDLSFYANATERLIYEDRLRKSITSIWSSFIYRGNPHELYGSTNERFDLLDTRALLKGSNKTMPIKKRNRYVTYTKIEGKETPAENYLTQRSNNLGGMLYWKSLPLQKYEEIDTSKERYDEDWFNNY